jgi:hypothetical protein
MRDMECVTQLGALRLDGGVCAVDQAGFEAHGWKIQEKRDLECAGAVGNVVVEKRGVEGLKLDNIHY